MDLQWLYKKIIKEDELCDLLPALIGVQKQEKLNEIIIKIRKRAAKRKIIKKMTFGKLPEPLHKTRRRNKLGKWFYKLFL